MNEWQLAEFGDLFDLIYRYPTYYNITYSEQGIPEIRGELLGKDGKIASDFRYVDENTAAQFPKVIVQDGDIVMSVRGTLGKVGLVTQREAGALITANLIRLLPNSSLADSCWLLYYLTSEQFQNSLDVVSSQTTIKTLQVPKLQQIKIDLPPLPEQRKIARILTTVDDLIERTAALVAKYQAVKQGLLHDLLTSRRRCSGPVAPTASRSPSAL